ncbi:ABC transporter ATP-binding protein [Nitratireductor aquimarinus]|uniref:ABC transporter ATP-binding protein n=1 Tax=Nitratireductor TaxID=245876 RepID=UPI0019D33F8A|nr:MULTISPECIES: ABC transporter ATP-binding protein [Nitratireductor]MBN7778835.1 ABC transporter ATP-binding protein [Nitratireductor pacificus]MBN7783158.1 ABC transporter ATP-binding protein [Nitratireductor pacificus]MBN7791969.1 ABC transporter ATP-binding protein [Nitratireductor aquimarinus]MBY6101223.1 ABC transporter ATP-binding protein [Nitratireductor aquimarinus]MCA1261696.1 ABC transporter ATP-binding protein [Nitratireductor aquimarinus]
MSNQKIDLAQTGRPVLDVRNLAVSLAGNPSAKVVSDVSFTVHPGETVCVVGESGSGKSVTAFSIMGLLSREALHCSGGRIELDGENVLEADKERLRALRATRMAMIFQEPMTALNPVETVGEQIDEVLRIHKRMGRKARREKVMEMLEAVHLPEPERIYSSYPHQLSGGQRQRVVICIALILEPRLLIADEPTTALDVTTQKQILLLIRELQEKHNTAVLFITHDFGVVADIADRVVVMNRGEVVEVGTREQILSAPDKDYTRMLVSSVPSLVPEAREAHDGDIVLSVKGLGKVYAQKRFLGARREVAAAVDVDLTVRRGEILGVVGESGSGKSTVARCIVRLQDPTQGEVVVCGENIAAVRGSALLSVRKRIQMVFQDPFRSLNPRLTVGESIIEGLTNFGVARAQALRRAGELMGLVGLPADALKRYPHQFSGGQRQRICIARALALEPDVLVADEAVSALDVSVQAQVLELLDDIRRKTGVGVLFITHDLRVAAQICDTIMVMQKGKIVEFGPAADVLTSPKQPYTQLLLEAAPGRHWDFQNFRPLPL